MSRTDKILTGISGQVRLLELALATSRGRVAAMEA
jgi:hypothetical protein